MNGVKVLLVLLLASAVLSLVIAWSAAEFGIHSVVFALVVAWAPNGWMLAVFAVQPLSLPESYFRVRSWEPPLYGKLGVRLFKKGLQSRFWQRRIPASFRMVARRDSLAKLESQMRDAETAHMLSFIFALFFAGFFVFEGRADSALYVMCFNMLLNGYPVMTQRYNRARIAMLSTKHSTT